MCPVLITKSPLFAGYSYTFLHPTRFVLPSLRSRTESDAAFVACEWTGMTMQYNAAYGE